MTRSNLLITSLSLLLVTACGGKTEETDTTETGMTETGMTETGMTDTGDTETTDTNTTETDELDISQDCTGKNSGICEIQIGDVDVDAAVTVTALVAGDAQKYGFFLVDPAGGAWSGIWVYTPGSESQEGLLMSGDEVTVMGTYVEYDFNAGGDTLSEIMIASAEDITVVSNGNSLPAATVLTVEEAGDSEIAEAFENSLVMVENVTVTSLPDQYGDFVVDGTLNVTQHAYAFPEEMAVGDTFTSIAGPYYFHYGKYKVVPVSEADVVGWTPVAE